MSKKNKENFEAYIKMLPLVGLITSFILFLLYFVVWKVDENPLIVSLYSLLPLFVYISIYVFAKIIKRK